MVYLLIDRKRLPEILHKKKKTEHAPLGAGVKKGWFFFFFSFIFVVFWPQKASKTSTVVFFFFFFFPSLPDNVICTDCGQQNARITLKKREKIPLFVQKTCRENERETHIRIKKRARQRQTLFRCGMFFQKLGWV